MRRATMSLGPPGGNGTMIRIGRPGKLAAPEVASEFSPLWARIGGQVESSTVTSNGSARFIAFFRRLLVTAILTLGIVVGKRSAARFPCELPFKTGLRCASVVEPAAHRMVGARHQRVYARLPTRFALPL